MSTPRPREVDSCRGGLYRKSSRSRSPSWSAMPFPSSCRPARSLPPPAARTVDSRVHGFTAITGARFKISPWHALPVRWLLDCRKFWCPHPGCPRTIFCERLPATFLGVSQQRTHAVWQALTPWGWTASAADVARVATHQGIPVSADTVLRALRAAPDPPAAEVRVVGLDEWAKRKGRTYATVVVDQERHRIVDVLPDASRPPWPRGCRRIRRSKW